MMDAGHGRYEIFPDFPGVGIELVHVLKQLPGVVFHDFQGVGESPVTLGVDSEFFSPEFCQ